jgi:hypothetical protein
LGCFSRIFQRVLGCEKMRYIVRNRCFVAGCLFTWVAVSGLLAGEIDDLAKRFHKHIEYLASDELEGRGVGSKGIETAAEYITAEFKKVGLEPAGTDGTFFQPFPIALERKIAEGGRLTFSGIETDLVQGRDFVPLAFSSSGSFSGKVVECGNGIVNPDKDYDAFKGLDIKDKVALITHGEPTEWADAEGNPTRHSLKRNKVYNAKDRGAAAVLFVNPPHAWADDVLASFESEGADDYGVPVLQITRQLATTLPVWITAKGDLVSMNDILKNPSVPAGPAKDRGSVQAEGEVKFEKRLGTTRNVLGALKGSGPQKDEWVVVGGHYDHLGLRVPMMRTFKDGKIVEGSSVPEIHNGADDNASGIAGLIEIGRAMAKGPKPNRSVLFIAFSAEESGLQGSKYYADHATAPLDKTVAMLNMDMIGRLSGDSVIVFGAHSADAFMPVLEAAGKEAGLKIHPGVDSGGRSDHAVFARKGIPSLHFYSGNHAEYHKPTDDTPLINAEGGARIATVVLETAKALANMPERPVYKDDQVAAKGAAVAKGNDPHAGLKIDDPDKLPTYRVVMGLSPSYADDGQAGMGVDAVSPEGPAQKAGMKAGDRILKINGKPVANIYDYMASTRENKGGDTVEVVVLREGKEQVLKVTLSGAR